ncbi:MAG TPA: PrsW family glutamic-type intramembrane protease [Bacteroidia bacterium]|nr:PrsW family glutamic-type intramembrane protease [Bacteroidia bacterium]
MTILHFIIGWLVVMAGYLLYWKFREDRKAGRSFFNFGDFNVLVASVTFFIAVYVAMYAFRPEPSFEDPDRQIAFGERTGQAYLVSSAIAEKIKHDPFNTDLHFRMLDEYFSAGNPPDEKAWEREGIRIFSYYQGIVDTDTSARMNDIANLMLAEWYVERQDRDAGSAAFHLRRVENKSQKYFNFISGKVVMYTAGAESAIPYFLDEIKSNGYVPGAQQMLAVCYDAVGSEKELRALVYDPTGHARVPHEIKTRIYFLDHKYLRFYEEKFSAMFSGIPFWGFLGDILILLAWFFFLRRLSFASVMKWPQLLFVVCVGVVLTIFSWLLYGFYHYRLHFEPNGKPGNDLLYCFFGIGFIEELIKLIPFLLILRFTRIIQKPIDYILVAAAAGLGFAFFENLLYISQYGLEVILSRALTASVSHMASSAVVAYGFILARYRYEKGWWNIPLFFLFAVLAHGFYDFWLLSGTMRSFAVITLFFYLSEILVFVSFINNALNQSVEEKSAAFNTSRLAALIAGSLILVFTIEYIGSCLTYGTTEGNRTLMNTFVSGGYLVFFLSIRLSNILVIPGKWMKIEFFTGLFPSEILGMRRRDEGFLQRRELVLFPTENSGPADEVLPLHGTMVRELKSGRETLYEFRAFSTDVFFAVKLKNETTDDGKFRYAELFTKEETAPGEEKPRLAYLGEVMIER